MIISRKRNPVFHPPLFMNGTLMKNTSYHKHLGLTFSNSGTWDEHVKSISEKSWSKLNLLRSLKFRVSRKSLEKMYFAYIRSVFEYSDVIWDNCSLESKQLLDAVHVEAARNVTGATQFCSIERLFMELGWESLQTRRNKHKLTTFYKSMHGLAPTYLSDLIPLLLANQTTMLSGMQIIFRASDQILTYSQTLSFHLPSKHGTAFQMR